MAAIVFPNGQSWIVSGAAFRRLLLAMRQCVAPTEVSLLGSLNEYEVVKGISLNVLELPDQKRMATLLLESVPLLLNALASGDEPLSGTDLSSRLEELRRRVEQEYRDND